MKQLTLSASAIKRYGYRGSVQGCPRRWAFAAIAGLREPGSKYTQDGTDCHAIAERWLSIGVLRGDPKWVSIVEESLHELPKPGTCGVEVPFRYEFEGIWFHGFIDALDFVGYRKIDHKFVSDFRYTMGPTELAQDPQAVIYALAPPVWAETLLFWNYVSKKGKGCKPCKLHLSRADAEDFMRGTIMPSAREMIEYYDVLTGVPEADRVDLINETVPCEPGDCWNFGMHCAHGARCTHIGYRSPNGE